MAQARCPLGERRRGRQEERVNKEQKRPTDPMNRMYHLDTINRTTNHVQSVLLFAKGIENKNRK